MTGNTPKQSDSTDDDHWHQETIDSVMGPIESEFTKLERRASDSQREAITTARDLLDQFEATLREAAAGDPSDNRHPREEQQEKTDPEQRNRP